MKLVLTQPSIWWGWLFLNSGSWETESPCYSKKSGKQQEKSESWWGAERGSESKGSAEWASSLLTQIGLRDEAFRVYCLLETDHLGTETMILFWSELLASRLLSYRPLWTCDKLPLGSSSFWASSAARRSCNPSFRHTSALCLLGGDLAVACRSWLCRWHLFHLV